MACRVAFLHHIIAIGDGHAELTCAPGRALRNHPLVIVAHDDPRTSQPLLAAAPLTVAVAVVKDDGAERARQWRRGQGKGARQRRRSRRRGSKGKGRRPARRGRVRGRSGRSGRRRVGRRRRYQATAKGGGAHPIAIIGAVKRAHPPVVEHIPRQRARWRPAGRQAALRQLRGLHPDRGKIGLARYLKGVGERSHRMLDAVLYDERRGIDLEITRVDRRREQRRLRGARAGSAPIEIVDIVRHLVTRPRVGDLAALVGNARRIIGAARRVPVVKAGVKALVAILVADAIGDILIDLVSLPGGATNNGRGPPSGPDARIVLADDRAGDAGDRPRSIHIDAVAVVFDGTARDAAASRPCTRCRSDLRC